MLDEGYEELKHATRMGVLGTNYDAVGKLLFLRFLIGKYKENKLIKGFQFPFRFNYIPLSLDRKLEVLDNLIADGVIDIRNFKQTRGDIIRNRGQYDTAYEFLLTKREPMFEPKLWELDICIRKGEKEIEQKYEKALEEFEIGIEQISMEKQKNIVLESLKTRKEYLGRNKTLFGYGNIPEENKQEINLFYVLLCLERSLKISITSFNYGCFSWELELNTKCFDNIEDLKIKRIDFPANIKWSDVSITFITGADVNVTVQGHMYKLNYKEMGFEDDRKRMPNKQWEFLKALAGLEGEVTWKDHVAGNQLKKRKQKLSDSLKVFFNIEENPFEDYRKRKMYRIKCRLHPEE